MSIITNNDIKTSIYEAAYDESTRIFNLQGLNQACEREQDIGDVNQFASNCTITHSDIKQMDGCHLTYTGNQASVDKTRQDSVQSLQQNIAVHLVNSAINNQCPPGNSIAANACREASKIKLTPGSHNIQNFAQTTEQLTSMIQDTMSNTCTSATGGLSTFLCVDSKLNKISLQQGSEIDTIASCVSRNIDNATIQQRASASIEQTSDVTIKNTIQDLYIVGVIVLGVTVSYFIFKWGSGKTLDQTPPKTSGGGDDSDDVPKTSIFIHLKLKLVALAFVWLIVIIGVIYIKNKNLGGLEMSNANLSTPSLCQDCTKYKTREDCRGFGLCTWVPKPVHPPNMCPPSPNASPASCLSPIAYQQKVNLLQGEEGWCTCEPIFDKNTGKQMSDCDNQCPNFRNEEDCTNAQCGWADTTSVLNDLPGFCVYAATGMDDPRCDIYTTEDKCNLTHQNTNAQVECKWLIPKRVGVQGGGYCTGDKTHCHADTKINFNTHLANAISLYS